MGAPSPARTSSARGGSTEVVALVIAGAAAVPLAPVHEPRQVVGHGGGGAQALEGGQRYGDAEAIGQLGDHVDRG
jgi:hypothetical protein